MSNVQPTPAEQLQQYALKLENEITLSHQKAQDVAKAALGNVLNNLNQSMTVSGEQTNEIARLTSILTKNKISAVKVPPQENKIAPPQSMPKK